jgi:hypothetical protein
MHYDIKVSLDITRNSNLAKWAETEEWDSLKKIRKRTRSILSSLFLGCPKMSNAKYSQTRKCLEELEYVIDAEILIRKVHMKLHELYGSFHSVKMEGFVPFY